MYYLSKILWAFFQPSTFIALLIVAGAVLAAVGRRSGLRLLIAGGALYLVAGFSPLANWLLVPLENAAAAEEQSDLNDAAGIIVLGGAFSGSAGSHITVTDSADRMTEAVYLASRYPNLPVIFSGGKGELFASGGVPEAEHARRFFDRFRITPPRLALEDRSRNTLENAVLTAKLLQPKPEQRWVLVTSAFHMPRAKALFEAQGFRIIPWPGDFRTTGTDDRWHFFARPSDGLRRLDLAAKEWAGLFVSWVRGDIASPLPS